MSDMSTSDSNSPSYEISPNVQQDSESSDNESEYSNNDSNYTKVKPYELPTPSSKASDQSFHFDSDSDSDGCPSDLSDQEIYQHWHNHLTQQADLARISRDKPPFFFQLLRQEQGHLLWEAFEPPKGSGDTEQHIKCSPHNLPRLDCPSIRLLEVELPAGTRFRRWLLQNDDMITWMRVPVPDKEIWRSHHLENIVGVYQPPENGYPKNLVEEYMEHHSKAYTNTVA